MPTIFTTPVPAWRPWLVSALLLTLLICLLAGCVPPPPRAGHAPTPPHPSALNHQPAKTGDHALLYASGPGNIFGNLQV